MGYPKFAIDGRRSSCVVRRAFSVNISSQDSLGQPLPNLVCNISWVKMRDIVSIQSKGDIKFKYCALKKSLLIGIDRSN